MKKYLTILLVCLCGVLFSQTGTVKVKKDSLYIKWCDFEDTSQIQRKQFFSCNKLTLFNRKLISSEWKVKSFRMEYINQSGLLVHTCINIGDSLSDQQLFVISTAVKKHVLFTQILIVNDQGIEKTLSQYVLKLIGEVPKRD